MDRMKFVQGVTRTKVLETRLLSRAVVDRMIDASNIKDVFRILNETEYSHSLINVSEVNDYEKILSNESKRVYELMREISVDQSIVDLLALKYDYHNLKVLVKEQEYNKDLSELYISNGIVEPDTLKRAYKDGDFTNVNLEFKLAIDATIKDLKENNDPQKIDLILDKYYFKHLYKMASDIGIVLFIAYVKDMIDFINVKSLIRLKKQGKDFRFFEDVILENGNVDKEEILSAYSDSIDNMIQKFKDLRISPTLIKGLNSYKVTNRLSDYEKYMDNYLMELNKSSKYINFGPEPIFSYLIAKETEFKNLRIIMVSKLNNLSPEFIRERMRDLYV